MATAQSAQNNKLITGIVLLGVVIALASAWGWWRYIYTTPENVFQRMLSSSLSTRSVTKQTTETSPQQSLDQTTQLSANPSPSVKTETTAAQAGSQITTQSIAFPDREFFRYTSILTTQDGQQVTSEQYADALNVWGYTGSTDEAQLFQQTLLGVVPIGRLQPEDKQALLQQIQQESVYSVDYDSVVLETLDGRKVYTYKVGLKPRAYVNMLKSFSAYLGTNELAEVNINDYPESPTLDIELSVDILSGQLRRAVYTGGDRVEKFSSQGAFHRVIEPTQYIPLPELQAKLQ